MILIGSAAIKLKFLDFPREPKDLDFIKTEKTEIPYFFNSDTRKEYHENPILATKYGQYDILPINVLYTLKISHMFWDIKWEKHMFDIQFLREKGCILDKDLFYELYNYWNEFHGRNRRSNLEMNAEDFFDNALVSEYKHDDLHTIINPVPTYTKILKDNAEVEVCENKFDNLSFEEKLELVREEVYIMAWERYKILDFRIAYAKMLKKFIMNHAPLWEAIFIIENFKILHKPTINYFKTIENGLSKIKQTACEFK